MRWDVRLGVILVAGVAIGIWLGSGGCEKPSGGGSSGDTSGLRLAAANFEKARNGYHMYKDIESFMRKLFEMTQEAQKSGDANSYDQMEKYYEAVRVKAVDELYEAVQAGIHAVAEKEGYDIVAAGYLHVPDGIDINSLPDITQEIIDHLNETYTGWTPPGANAPVPSASRPAPQDAATTQPATAPAS